MISRTSDKGVIREGTVHQFSKVIAGFIKVSVRHKSQNCGSLWDSHGSTTVVKNRQNNEGADSEVKRLGERQQCRMIQKNKKTRKTRMWANAQRHGHLAKYRWHPLFNATKFGWRSILECRAVTLPRCETLARYCCLTSFFPDCRYVP